jgi:hypothetical protein
MAIEGERASYTCSRLLIASSRLPISLSSRLQSLTPRQDCISHSSPLLHPCAWVDSSSAAKRAGFRRAAAPIQGRVERRNEERSIDLSIINERMALGEDGLVTAVERNAVMPKN